jgi:hypothetical protein
MPALCLPGKNSAAEKAASPHALKQTGLELTRR